MRSMAEASVHITSIILVVRIGLPPQSKNDLDIDIPKHDSRADRLETISSIGHSICGT